VSLIGLAALPFGICAWVMGARDLRKMAEGSKDPTGRGMTTGGMVTGIVGTVLGVVDALIAVGMMVFFLLLFGMPFFFMWSMFQATSAWMPPPPMPAAAPAAGQQAPLNPALPGAANAAKDMDYRSVAFSPDGNTVAALGGNGVVKLFDGKTGVETDTLTDQAA